MNKLTLPIKFKLCAWSITNEGISMKPTGIYECGLILTYQYDNLLRL